MDSTNKVYVTIIDLAYEVVSVGSTEEESRRIAGQQALSFLVDTGAVTHHTDTVEKVLDYFGTRTHEVAVGAAVLA
jgi:hypothetical protein